MRFASYLKLLIALGVFFNILSLTSCSKHEQYPIKRENIIFLALNSKLSIVSQYGKHFNNGVRMALNEINANGGVNGAKVLVEYQDDFLNQLASKQLMVDYRGSNILAAFGTFFSAPNEGIAEGANHNKIPFLSTGYSDVPIYTHPSEYVYSLRPGMQNVLYALAKEAVKIGNLNRWTVITYSNSEGIRNAKFFEKALLHLSSEATNQKEDKNQFLFHHVYTSPFKVNEYLDMKDLKNSLASTKAVIILTNGKDLQTLVDKNNLASLLQGRVVFVPFAGEPEWWEYSKDELTPENWIINGYPWYAIKSMTHTTFYKKYQKLYKMQPRYASVLGYLSVYVLAEAAKKIDLNNPDIFKLRDEFAQALQSVRLKDTPMGEVFFRKDHISSIGVFTGMSYLFSENIIGHNSAKMRLKDIRMKDIQYYPISKISMDEKTANKIRTRNLKRDKKIEKLKIKRLESQTRCIYNNGKHIGSY